MSAISLYKNHSKQELLDMDSRVMADPASKNPAGGVFLYTPKVRTLLANIAQAITWHMEDQRKKDGNPVQTAGYSGRMSNK